MTLDNVMTKFSTNLSTKLLRGTVGLLIFVLAACGSSGPAEPAAPVEMTTIAPTDAPTDTPATAPTEVPTVAEPTAEEATPEQPTPATASEPTAAPAAEAPQLSFTPATYTDESAGFQFDYPADWTLDPSSQIGARGAQALLLSPGTTMETLADGGTRLGIVTYVWDPKNDLDAYIAQRKIAWDSSGFTITREETWQLPDGSTAYVFEINSPDQPTFMFFTTVGEDYLQLAGDGDQALIEEIAHTFRPLN